MRTPVKTAAVKTEFPLVRLALAPLLLVLGVALPRAAVAAPVQRTLEFKLVIDATQDWRNGNQWSKSNTQQRYALSAQLRSDGRRYADNLLDPDLTRRLQIKSDWYLYQGLQELKAENAGKLPAAGTRQSELSAESLAMSGGMASPALANISPQRLTALEALRNNKPEELEAFMRGYDQTGGRWMVFEGFTGCANSLQLTYNAKFEGDVATKPGNKAPFDMQWNADTRGTAEQQESLCRRYVATYDATSDTLFVENLYLPSPHGTSTRSEFGRTERKEADLAPVYEVMGWADAALKRARSSGERTATLPIVAALDGRDAARGHFEGRAAVRLEWSFR